MRVETTFSLEPVTPLATHIDLPALQQDMDTIAGALPDLIGEQAKNLMRDSMPCFVSATGAD